MFVHDSNKKIINVLMKLQDERGKQALNHVQCRIIEIIGRFPRKNGNYMLPKNMLDLYDGRKPTLKTFRHHLAYMEDQGIVSITWNEGRRVRRLSVPQTLMVESLAAYRARKGVNSYAYRNKAPRRKNMDSSFLPGPRKFFHKPGENFSPIYKDEYGKSSIDNDYPQIYPLVEDSKGGPSAHNAAAQGPPHKRGSRRVSEGGIHTPSKGNDSEPLPRGKESGSQTQAQRAAEANRLIKRGHVANPLGKPNNRGRRLKPSAARPIDPNSKSGVTIAQLFRAYVEVYDQAFGVPGLLQDTIPATREYMETFVGRIKQVFYDVCGYGPTNREIAEYIKWFHDPAMLASIRKVSNRIPEHPGVPHPNQLLGRYYVRMFFDRHLSDKNPRPPELMSRGEIEARKTRKLVEQAYVELRNAGDKDFDQVLCLVTYGFVIFSEYLRDERSLNPSNAKRYMINLMARYMAKAKDKASAKRYLERTHDTTERLPVQDSSLWGDWRTELKDAVKIACDLSMQPPEGISHE